MMSLRARTTSTKQEPTTKLSTSSNSSDDFNEPETKSTKSTSKPAVPLTFSQRAISQTLTSTANLANLLPTGTLLAFQLLTPVFTNHGACDSATRPMTLFLLALLAVSCFVASFTDSVKSSDGQKKVYYGIATFNGIFLFDCPDPICVGLKDLSKYKIRFRDGVHAVLSVLVFVAVSLKDRNVSTCFYPTPQHETQQVLNIVPVGIGVISGLLFVVFPTKRHGIGYPVTTSAK